MKKSFYMDWDVVAGIVAAIVAMVLHFLHVVDTGTLLAMMMLLLVLLLFRDLRREHDQEALEQRLVDLQAAASRIQSAVQVPDAVLIGPARLRAVSTEFSQRATGEMLWFNVCLLMFKPQALFDALLRPAIENPQVTSIQFILNESERQRWRDDVLPKVRACSGSGKVMEPHWCELNESVSFIFSGTDHNGTSEVLLSFWGEPFMARTTGMDVPRYLFHVQPQSELITRLREVERNYRFGR